jgi:superfamily II DNA/RNA helicase
MVTINKRTSCWATDYHHSKGTILTSFRKLLFRYSQVQETALRQHPDVVVATPGRIIDHVRNAQSVGLEDLAILVLDEADRLLEMGFVDEVKEIVRNCPKKRQTLLFR